MKLHPFPLVLCAALLTTGCARLDALWPFNDRTQAPASAPGSGDDAQDATRPQSRPGTQEEEGAAASVDTAALRSLGTSVATLGDPSRPGLWVETPLTDTRTRGRAVLADGGQGVDLDLIPAPGTGGSRMSPAAMRALGLPLSALAEVELFGP
ncbi:MAG: hypothetical protein FH759_02515 [Sediminimonas qiaohouensis]|uniref:D-galactarate dehydratase n=1 Tax=Sediminimonas qiaohouensis TaxID=552061 RepID=A0A7C9LQF8_9RHOB|nr:hypothetical protein [Sediminimonas qiaohouensis]MTJ03556.1 hypothetical protein [Sediminimonas qiaohouensis]